MEFRKRLLEGLRVVNDGLIEEEHDLHKEFLFSTEHDLGVLVDFFISQIFTMSHSCHAYPDVKRLAHFPRDASVHHTVQ